MTAKFEAFKVALHALCLEHGVHLRTGNDYDDYGVYVEEASEEWPAGLHIEFDDAIPPTPEEQAADEERWRVYSAQQRILDALRSAEHELAHAEVLASPEYNDWLHKANAEAKQQRENLMRVSTDPTDPAYIDDRPRKVWCNDIEVEGWTVADEFRRSIVTPTKVHNGSVRIERLADDGDVIIGDGSGQALPPIDSGFSGVLVPEPKPTPEPTPAPAAPAAPAAKKPKAKRRR